ncbi:MAG: acyl carrier protein [Alphaproteobacteria bacterium]|mgnify:CR=1 FL=1|nr:acyl carrier protein [Alphaproteobacteria bacterium]
MSTTFEKVKELVIKNLGVPAEKVVESANFVNDLGADSLDVVEFVMEVEKVFDVEIPDDAAGQLVTVGDAVKYIDEHMKK